MVLQIILPFIPIIALIIQNVVHLETVLEYQAEELDIDRQVRLVLSCLLHFYSFKVKSGALFRTIKLRTCRRILSRTRIRLESEEMIVVVKNITAAGVKLTFQW